MADGRGWMGWLRGDRQDGGVAPDRRRDIRHSTVYQVARLGWMRGEELCLLRDVSPNGLKAEIYRPVQTDERVTVTLKTGQDLTGHVAWTNDRHFGMRFDAELPILSMLAHCSVDDRFGNLRPPRIATSLPARLRTTDDERTTQILDASQAGMKIAIDQPIAAGVDCTLLVEGLGWRGGTIRWSRDGHAGVLLHQPMSFTEFGGWRTALLPRDEPAA